MAGNFRRYSSAKTQLSSTVSQTDTYISVTASSSLPSLPPFDIIIDAEICTVIGVSSEVYLNGLLSLSTSPSSIRLQVSRAQEGTSATRHLVGRPVSCVLTKKGLLSLADDNGYSGLVLKAGSSITIQADKGDGIFLVDPLDNIWREFPAGDDIAIGLMESGQVADVYAYWLDGSSMVEYEIIVWTSPQTPPFKPTRDGVLVSPNSPTRRYIGSVQKKNNFFSPTVLDIETYSSTTTIYHCGFRILRIKSFVAVSTLYGLQQASDGEAVVLINTSATQKVVLVNNSSSALSKTKFFMPSGGNLTVDPGNSVTVVYDSVDGAWRAVSNCYIRPPMPGDPLIQANSIEDGDANLLAYDDGSGNVIFYQGT
jgi:hypothetical protein